MKIFSPIPLANRPFLAAFTLVEMLFAVAIGVVVIGGVVSLSIVTTWHFTAASNYVQLENQSRNALDKMSKEIRNSTALVAFSTNNPQYLRLTNASGPDGATVTYDSTLGTLVLAKPGVTNVTLLTGCTSFSFQLFDRYPLITGSSISFYSSTNFSTGLIDPTFTKIINMSWKCSRTIFGSKMNTNTEIVQTAQIVLRNKVK